MKKLFTTLLTIALVSLLAVTAYALDPGITVTNPDCDPCYYTGDGVITGQVLDTDSNPIEGATVESQYGNKATSNSSGYFTMHHYGTPGMWVKSYYNYCYSTEQTASGAVKVADEEVTTLDIVLEADDGTYSWVKVVSNQCLPPSNPGSPPSGECECGTPPVDVLVGAQCIPWSPIYRRDIYGCVED